MFLDNVVCTDLELLRLMILVKTFMNIIQIILPLGLIILMLIDVLKSVTGGNSDEINKKLKIIPKRLTIAVIVFLIPTIVKLVSGIVDKNFEYAACFTNANEETRVALIISQANEALSQAEKTKESALVKEALVLINKIEDENKKDELFNRAEAVLKVIKEDDYEKFLAEFGGPTVNLRDDAYKEDEDD